jgi:hypothetical protein
VAAVFSGLASTSLMSLSLLIFKFLPRAIIYIVGMGVCKLKIK